MQYQVVYDNGPVEYVEADTLAKARWQAVRHRLDWLDRRDRKHLFSGVTVRRVPDYVPPPTPQEQADEWNAAHPVGTLVRYWRGLREGEPSGTGRVRHAAQPISGHVSVWIDGCCGCVAVSHVEATDAR